MHLRVIDWRGGVFYGAYRDCFGVRVYAVYLFICCAERLPARDTFKNAGGCAAVYGVCDDYPQTCAKIPVCGDWGFSNTKECSIIEA